MPCIVNLRHDQTSLNITERDGIVVFAANWVESALKILGQTLQGIIFQVKDHSGSVLQTFTLTENISLQELQIIARVDPRNVTGVINSIYYPDISDRRILYALRDLVRQCIIVGLDETTHFGGYGGIPHTAQKGKVYIIDLAALQFQQPYNSGRLVLIPEHPGKFPVGLLDYLIFENVVGEPKPTYETASTDAPRNQRYVKETISSCGNVYFDKFAYAKFVSQDVILSGIALNQIATSNGDKNIYFKFLKYGTGFFAGKFATLLNSLILSAVIDGLEILFEKFFKSKENTVIKHVEFPFFSSDRVQEQRLEKLKKEFGVECSFSKDDALEIKSKDMILATTNCGDPHAVIGNEMGFGSVDAAIAENLKSKGNIFCPCLNARIQGEILHI